MAAQRVGKSRSAVTNALRLLALSPEVRHLVEIGQLSAGHARGAGPPFPCFAAAGRRHHHQGKPVRAATELLVKRLSAEAEPAKKPKDADTVDYLTEAQNDLKAWLCPGCENRSRDAKRVESSWNTTARMTSTICWRRCR